MSTLPWRAVTGTHRRAKIVTVVLTCPKCAREHTVGVTVEDVEPMVTLPDNCRCGEPLDTPTHHVMCSDTALRLLENTDWDGAV
jgi:hypothetical protein